MSDLDNLLNKRMRWLKDVQTSKRIYWGHLLEAWRALWGESYRFSNNIFLCPKFPSSFKLKSYISIIDVFLYLYEVKSTGLFCLRYSGRYARIIGSTMNNNLGLHGHEYNNFLTDFADVTAHASYHWTSTGSWGPVILFYINLILLAFCRNLRKAPRRQVTNCCGLRLI